MLLSANCREGTSGVKILRFSTSGEKSEGKREQIYASAIFSLAKVPYFGAACPDPHQLLKCI